MLNAFVCSGHPRDLGLAQGHAAREAIRAEVARLELPLRRSRLPTLRPLVSGPLRGQGAGRALFRHFAHQAERLEGIARAADLPLDSLLEMHLRLRGGGAAAGLLARRALVRAGRMERLASAAPGSLEADSGEKQLVLERGLPEPVEGEGDWIVRESRPAVGFRSIELTLPWLVSSVAGVNQGGLAVAGAPLLWGESGTGGRPSSLLLVQECLQRFEDLGGALDWCRTRPVEGEQSIVLADASGAIATVIVGAGERRVQSGEGELQLEAGEPGVEQPTTRHVRLEPAARRLVLEAPGSTFSRTL